MVRGDRSSVCTPLLVFFDRQLHETLGLCVFTLVVMRVLWRMGDTRPAPPQVPRWMGVTALAVKGALYVLLFAVPLTAMAGAWLEGHSLTFLPAWRYHLSFASRIMSARL